MINTLIKLRLPSGNLAIYDTPPHLLPRKGLPASYSWPIEYAEQIAVKFGDVWHVQCKPATAEQAAACESVEEVTV